MRRADLLALPLLAAIAACEPSEFRPVPVPAGGGGGYSAPARPAQRLLAPGADRMLENPDAETIEDSAEVWAETEAEAEAQCREIARQRTQQGGTLVTVRGVSRINNSKFFCQLRVETGRLK